MRNYHTDYEEPKWREMVEGYDLDDGTAVFVAVEFEFSPADGLVPIKLAYINEIGQPINVSDFSYNEQMWLADAIAKDVARFTKRYYDKAEASYVAAQDYQSELTYNGDY